MEKNEKGVNRLLERTLKFIAIRPRSEKEIRAYLKRKRKKSSPELIEKIIQKLKILEQVDDLKFAQWWIEQRTTFRPKGKIGLQMELRQKGVERDLIEKTVSGIDELSLAKKALKKKSHLLDKQKLINFLSYRGFSWTTIKQALEEIGKKR